MAPARDFLPFHEDEVAAQDLAGYPSGGRRAPIRPHMPEEHRLFFPLLPALFTATGDDAGWPMASFLSGVPGFVQAPTATTLQIHALPPVSDPAAAGFEAGREIGLLGLDLSTRRRNRANGRIVARSEEALSVEVTQSFGNCPQYIQRRVPTDGGKLPALGASETLTRLDAGAAALIGSADTFFVASRGRRELADAGGFDMSHRGGRPGFVDIHDDTLVIPDFRGNRFFNTLGNLLGDARAALLFVDFESGDVLQLQGRVAIDWHPAGVVPAGTERLWRVRISQAWRRRAAFPGLWQFSDWAPTTLATGTWQQAARMDGHPPGR